MSVIGSNILAGASGQGGAYNLTNSLRFRSSASAYLSRTPSSSGNSQTWTWSGWVKLGTLGTDRTLFSAGTNTSNRTFLYIRSDNRMQLYTVTSGSVVASVAWSPNVYRDPSAWYHFVIVCDTTNATTASRLRFYANGVQVTGVGGGGEGDFPAQNANTFINTTIAHGIGRSEVIYTGSPGDYFDGYIAELNFIDGQALTPSSFGETSTTTGVWIPKKYTGTYGTNGFYLPFTNTASTSTLGNDFSGNSNTWTVNNISLTAGTTYDSMTDVPTLAELSGNGNSNYAVFNPLQIITTGQVTVTNGNLTASNTSGGDSNIRGTIFASTGKWYAELTITTAGSNYPTVGIIEATEQNLTYLGATAKSYCYTGGGSKGNNNSFTSYGASYTTGDVIGVAYDATNATLTFYKNGTSQGTAFTGVTAGSYTFACSTLTGTININCGQRPFAYTPPTGFNRLNTFNLPTPTIGATASTQANDYFDVVTYTGTGADQNITTLNFQPSFTWIKNRASAYDHYLYDAVRGGYKIISSNTTGAEATQTNGLSAFLSNGFSLVGNRLNVNENGVSHVAWNWKANGSGSTNTDGSITSTVSANTSAGFSIVTWTNNNTANQSIGHGLGVTPSMIITKDRDNGTYNWATWFTGFSKDEYLLLNTTGAKASYNTLWYQTPTSSVFYIGSTGTGVNAGTDKMVAYCFAPVAGYSAMGSYTGNGSSDGVFVFTGFRPRFVMYKRTDSTGGWIMYDTARDTSNVVDLIIEAQSSGAEGTGSPFADIDFVSNGFKTRGTSSAINASGGTYIYMAFCESPFKFSNAR